MTTPPGLAARALCAAADEALTEASFRTADFAEAERLFTEARDLAAGDGDRDGEALAVTGLGMTRHGRNIARLAGGAALSDADVAAEEELMRGALAAWRETGDAAGTARALFGLSLVFQVLRRDWDAGMPYLWQAFGLAEAVEESGDLYGASEIRRHPRVLLPVQGRPPERSRPAARALARAAGTARRPAPGAKRAGRARPGGAGRRRTAPRRRVPVPGGRTGPRRRPAALADPGRRANSRRGRGSRPRGRLTPRAVPDRWSHGSGLAGPYDGGHGADQLPESLDWPGLAGDVGAGV